MTVRLVLFGSPTVEYDGKSVALAFERRNQLLVFLALKRAWVGRAELAALLWPEQQNKLAYTNLRKTLHRLQSLPWARGIESQGSALRYETETDVFAFDSALREQRLADALSMHRGELLSAFDDDQSEAWSSWLNFERDRLRSAWRDAALSRLGAEIDPTEGIELSARLLEADPLDEAALRAHMTWLAHSGQSARARQAYREFGQRLSRDLGLDPGVELRALHDSLGTPIRAPDSAAAVKVDHDFIGRTVELRRIGSLLAQDDCRLICVLGPGGVGKTRFARRAINEFARGFSAGAAFVPLEDIGAVSELGGQLARELRVALSGSAEPLDQVIKFLREQHMLLVLDNFEHLAAHASILQKLLQACPRLKIIVTSRIRLALPTEWLLPLEGLPCPEVEDQDRLDAFDAVRLFVQAAHRVQPALAPAAEAAAIVDICRQVEGLPLALELAASWTRVLPCEAIAAELHRGTELLRTADSMQPAKHASIEFVFDQSWRLLSAVEQDALSRLSIFSGGFSAEAARAIAGASLPVLSALIDKSLLRKDGARLSTHPLVHQLAAFRLGDGPVFADTEAAHAMYFHRLLGQLKSAAAAGERTGLQTIDVEFENYRRAWTWAIQHAAADALERSSAALVDYCDYRGRYEEGLTLLRQAAESPLATNNTELRSLLLSRVAHLEYRLNRFVDAESNARRALEGTRRGRDDAARRQALNVLATCALQLGRLDDARRYFKQTLEAVAPEDHAHWAAVTLDHLALIEKRLGNYDEALRLSLQSLVQHRQIKDSAGEALCLNNLGSLSLARHEYEAAATYLKQSLAICERDGIISTRGFIFCNQMDLAMRAGDAAAAASYADRALEVANATGANGLVSWVTTNLATLAVRRGDIGAARSALAEALSIALAINTPSLKFDALNCFAEILEAQGHAPCARQILAYAAEHPTATEQVRDLFRARLGALPKDVSAKPAWPELELDDLLRRIVVEADIAHAPLIATLRGELVH